MQGGACSTRWLVTGPTTLGCPHRRQILGCAGGSGCSYQSFCFALLSIPLTFSIKRMPLTALFIIHTPEHKKKIPSPLVHAPSSTAAHRCCPHFQRAKLPLSKAFWLSPWLGIPLWLTPVQEMPCLTFLTLFYNPNLITHNSFWNQWVVTVFSPLEMSVC